MTVQQNSGLSKLLIASLVIPALLCLFASPTNVVAEDKLIAPCDFSKFGIPVPLVRNEVVKLRGKIFDVEKLKARAIVVDVSDASVAKLPELEEKTYIYVIDKSGKLALIERFIDPGLDVPMVGRTPIFGSHEGLFRMLQSASVDKIELVAAGEVVIRNGRVYAVSNGAGTYRGTTDHLNYGLEKLKTAGLKVDDRTEVRDHSTRIYKDPHDVDGRPTIEALRKLSDPKFASVVAEARRVMKVLDARYKDADTFFYRAFEATSELEDRTKDPRYLGALMLQEWQGAHNNEIFVLNSYFERYGEAEVRRILHALESFPPP